ncbi:MAG: class I SAM-dependent methyltransferase [Rhodobacterales bacterium]|nr:class I SAM-dependent methyltransferase [Rhodobacterales bacterium]
MSHLRLSLALDGGGLTLPDEGRIAIFAPHDPLQISPLPKARCHVITGFKPDFDLFEGAGFECSVAPEGRYCAVIVVLPRAKAQGFAMIAQAAEISDGPVIIDGAKTDGVESMLRVLRKRGPVSGPISKAHGKIFWIENGADLSDWAATETKPVEGGFTTAPGVFSADGIDPASLFLADNLPVKLGGNIVDLGAGWGYLAARILERETVKSVDLVEADYAALACARQNVNDPRANFHWADAPGWTAPNRVETVVMNPPFHAGRKADPEIGRAFIAAAANMLAPNGHLWMVANRHLPYEPALHEAFSQVEEVAGNSRFKILHGQRPSRHKR